MKLIFVFLVITFLGLQYKLWLGDNGVWQARRLKEKCVVLEQENQKLRQRNHAIESEIIGLKSGGQALEEQARAELGMVKQGEEYYQFVD